MTIDENGRVHIIYYDEQGGYYRPYYRTVSFIDNNRDSPILSDPIPIANSLTSSTFTRPGEYMSIKLDSEGVPQVVWSDGRNGEMDIYYAHGVYSAVFPIESVAVITGAAIVAIAVIVLILRKYRGSNAASIQ